MKGKGGKRGRLGDEKCAGDPFIAGGKLCVVRSGKDKKMSVCDLPGSLDPDGKFNGRLRIGNLRDPAFPLHRCKHFPRGCHGDIRLRKLGENTYESQFGDAAGGKGFSHCPACDTFVKSMLFVSERDQRVDVEKVFHGKSASISLTRSLVSIGIFPLASRTENPLPRSLTIFPFDRAGAMGSRTIVRFSLRTEKTVPVESPRARRRAALRTTWPLDDKTVVIVRLSYMVVVVSMEFRLFTIFGKLGGAECAAIRALQSGLRSHRISS